MNQFERDRRDREMVLKDTYITALKTISWASIKANLRAIEELETQRHPSKERDDRINRIVKLRNEFIKAIEDGGLYR